MYNDKAVKDFISGLSDRSDTYVSGYTDKNPLKYKVNENITFRLRVCRDNEIINIPYLLYTLEGDDGKKKSGYAKSLNDGSFVIQTSLSENGFTHLVAKACDENKSIIENITPFEGGAGADVDKIERSTDIPDDYFAFWDNLKAEIYKTNPKLIYKKELSEDEIKEYVMPGCQNGFEFYEYHIALSGEMYTSCVVSYPKCAKAGSLKLNMSYRGYGVEPLKYIRAYEGYMTVTVSPHSLPCFETDEYYESLRTGSLLDYGFNNEENEKPETTYWAKMLMRDLLSFRFFKNHELVNKKDYVFTGGSQGGMQAINMAVHSGVECECFAFVPWFADLNAVNVCHRLAGWRPEFRSGLGYFDSAVAASHLKCPITIMAGLGDYICPPSGIMAMYNSIKSPKNLVFIQNKQHPGFPDEIFTYEMGTSDIPENTKEILNTENYKFFIC